MDFNECCTITIKGLQMTKKALFLTVGGTSKPVVDSLKKYTTGDSPVELVYFFCSKLQEKTSTCPYVDGEGFVIPEITEQCPNCKKKFATREREKSILCQSRYKGEYKKVALSDPYSFQECYKGILEEVDSLNEEYQILVDLTGGTKIMSSALFAVGLVRSEVIPLFSHATVRNTSHMEGSSYPEKIDVRLLQREILFSKVALFIKKQHFSSAAMLLKEFLGEEISDELCAPVREKYWFCEGFAKWDRFEYEEAFSLLKDYRETIPEQLEVLLQICEKGKFSGYEKVFDLLSNAVRQVKQGYFDNAAARMYRAIELFAQIRLYKEYSTDTSNVQNILNSLSLLEKNRWEAKKNDEGKIRIGLKDAYELLLDLKDPVGTIYQQEKDRFVNLLEVRNNSKLAHGDTPVTEDKWKEMESFFLEFIQKCCDEISVCFIEISFPENL
jgi:CRISPR-associated protein (TIGR02710 family)